MTPTNDQDKLVLTELKCVIETDVILASAKTINTFELLENILLFLDLRTLLCSQRVCTSFQGVIQISSKIRKALFFEPLSSSTSAQITLMKSWESSDMWNDAEIYFAKVLPEGMPKVTPVNPLLPRHLSYGLGSKRYECRSKTIRVSSMDSEILQKLHDSPASASWRRVLVIQPHASPMDVIGQFNADEHPVTKRKPLNAGLRMERLVHYELYARRMLNGKAKGEEMKFTSCGYYYDTVQVSSDPKFVLGSRDIFDLYKFEIGMAAKEICGWDVLSPGLRTHVEYPRSWAEPKREYW